MISKISFIFDKYKQFIRYLVVGGSSFVLDMSILACFKYITGASATWGVVVSQGVVIFYNFLLNKYWSFESKGMGHTQLFRYFGVFALNYLTGIGVMYFFHDKMGFHYLLVRTFTIMSFVPINFFLYRFFVYREIPSQTVELADLK